MTPATSSASPATDRARNRHTMEKQIIGRGLLAGALAGVLAFVFAKIFLEPIIGRAIDFEDGIGAAHEAMEVAGGGHSHGGGRRAVHPRRAVHHRHGFRRARVQRRHGRTFRGRLLRCPTAGSATCRPALLSVLVAGGMLISAVDRSRAEVPAESAGHQPRRDDQPAHAVVPADGGAVGAADGRGGVPGSSTDARSWAPGMRRWPPRVATSSRCCRDAGPADHRRNARADASTTRATSSSRRFPAEDLYEFRLYTLTTQVIIWTTIGLVFAALVSRLLEEARRQERRPSLRE